MALIQRLLSLKASQLRHTAFLLGIPTTGSKAELSSSIRSQLLSQPPPPKSPKRIVSIDMGIKNLGICVLTPSTPSSPNTTKLHIQDWRKLDLLSQSTLNPLTTSTFSPKTLSPLAISIAQTLLSTYQPTTILIERQRFRSGGASAVQEWTLRVNMLESMLWAAFVSMRRQQDQATGKGFATTEEVSPARVATFFCAAPEGFQTFVPSSLFDGDVTQRESASPAPTTMTMATSRAGKKKVDKKEKIALVRSWLSGTAQGQHPDIEVEISDKARIVADAFLPGRERGSGKLDDLADCLVQGVAWVRWRENEEKMRGMLRREIEEETSAVGEGGEEM